MTRPTLAVLATIPQRVNTLAACLASLRSQVDVLRVICHDVTEPPAAVRDYADDFICEPDHRGSAAKLQWATSWDGIYLGCDDDFRYPADYVRTMREWVARWKGRALVTCHGQVYLGRASHFMRHARVFAEPRKANDGQWINYPGACAIAWDAALRVPDRVPEKNWEEPYLALWAQRHKIPIWLVPKTADWLQWILPPNDPGPTIWGAEKMNDHADRNRLLAVHPLWKVYRVPGAPRTIRIAA